jgi:hypothetical protein
MQRKVSSASSQSNLVSITHHSWPLTHRDTETQQRLAMVKEVMAVVVIGVVVFALSYLILSCLDYIIVATYRRSFITRLLVLAKLMAGSLCPAFFGGCRQCCCAGFRVSRGKVKLFIFLIFLYLLLFSGWSRNLEGRDI